MNFPVDTRSDTKANDNRQFSTYSYQQPIQQSLQNPNILDRNYFQMNHQTTNSDSLRLHNPSDRLFETSQIYQNFSADPQNSYFGADPQNSYFGADPQNRNFGADPQNRNFGADPQNRNFGADPQSHFQKTRTSKSEDESLSRVFIDIPHRNYENEVSQRLNGFGIVPKDTRYENDTKSKTNDTANMRTNRSFGTPSNNL